MKHLLPTATQRSRRQFLGAGLGSIAGLAAPFALNLTTMASVSAQSAVDHKALVCVFLYGGNDHANTMMPATGAERAAWAAARPELLLSGGSLAISPASYSGVPQAFASQISELHSLFTQGKCAVLANVGPLVYPMTRAQWNNGDPIIAVPPQIASHSDQANIWQTGIPDQAAMTGWLGRIGDAINDTYNSGSLSMCVSTGGDNTMQVGEKVLPYQITTNGPVSVAALGGVHGAPAAAHQALREILTESHAHLFMDQYAKAAGRSINAYQEVSTALAGVSLTTAFPDSSLGRQLRMCARMIGCANALGQRRQVFFVSSGGWDFHGNQVADQTAKLQELSKALSAFYSATEELKIPERVTTFTASDFGRALQSNGDGTDHGWGSHHFMMGGAVRGNRIYGTVPDAALNTSTDIGQGRLLPTTSVDAYAATLARWFGVSDTDLPLVLPNVRRFLSANTDLGFML